MKKALFSLGILYLAATSTQAQENRFYAEDIARGTCTLKSDKVNNHSPNLTNLVANTSVKCSATVNSWNPYLVEATVFTDQKGVPDYGNPRNSISVTLHPSTRNPMIFSITPDGAFAHDPNPNSTAEFRGTMFNKSMSDIREAYKTAARQH